MRKNLKYVYYRHPRTRAEARANQEGWERPCRRLRNLPDAYDDLYPTHEKTWKNKRKTQYRPGGRGKERSIIVDADFTYEWDLSEYFKEHDIPYRIEYVNEPYSYKRKTTKRVRDEFKTPYYITRFYRQDGKMYMDRHIVRWEWKYHWEYDGGFEWIHTYRTVAYKVIWWYDKDVGIDYILAQCRRRHNIRY